MKNKEENQQLYEWAVLQIISLDKWKKFSDKLVEYMIENKANEIEKQKEVAREKFKDNNKKLSRVIQALEVDKRLYASTTRKNFHEYGHINSMMVSEFRKCDNNPILEEAGKHINQWFKDHFDVTD